MSDTAPVVEAVAEPVVETAPVAVPEAPNSTKLLDLAKKEAQFVRKEVEYKGKMAEYEKQLEELKYFKGAKDVLGKNPEELLEKLGISYDELTKSILDYYDNKDKAAKPPSVEELRQEIAREFQQREAQKAEALAAQAVEGFNKEIGEFVKSNEDKYPHLTKLGTTLGQTESTEELIFGVVSSYFEETGELLDLETAANTAEEYFKDEWNKLNGVLTGKGSEAPKVEEVTPAKVAEVVAHKGNNIIGLPDAPTVGTTSYKRFKEVVSTSPTLSNAIPVKTATPFRERRLERDELINKAVLAYENAARVKR